MARLIDAEQFEKELRAMWLDLHGRRPPLKHPVTMKKIRTLLKKQGEIECIPIAWIMNNPKLPKEGPRRDAIMDMIEDWRKEHGIYRR